jgi:hypothetical protein
MKHKIYYGSLAAAAVVCAAFSIARESFAGAFTAVAAFPFEQIGMGLRALSLSGGLGNAAAIGIYVILSLLPIGALPFLARRREIVAEDGLLVLLSVALFFDLYFMVNPGTLGIMIGGQTGKAVFGSVVYAIVCGYVVLRALRLFVQSDAPKLLRYMTVMLGVLGVFFVAMASGACVSDLLTALAALNEGNEGNTHLLGASYAFLVIKFAVNALPYVLDVFVIAAALRLLTELRADRYSGDTVAQAERMSRLCVKVLVITIMANIGFDLLQLVVARAIRVVNMVVIVPVIPIAFVLAALLLTRFIAENKKLKDDNDMFI